MNRYVATLLVTVFVLFGLIGYGMVKSHLHTVHSNREIRIVRLAIACKQAQVQQLVCIHLMTSTFVDPQ